MGSVTETPRGERIAAILLYLIHRRNRQHSVEEIQNHLNQKEPVILRNVQRDCKRLAECHDEVIGVERRENRLYYFIKPDMRDKLSLPLSRNSLLALFLLKRLQPFFAPGSKSLTQMAETLNEITSNNDFELFEDLDTNLADNAFDFGERPVSSLDDTLFETLLTALVHHKKLEITYRRSVGKDPSIVTICPVRLVLYKGALYFAAIFNDADQHYYYYKLCRIIDACLTDEKFKVSKNQLALFNKRLTSNFGMLDDDDAVLEDISIRFPAHFDLLLQEQRFHASQKVSRDKDKNMILTMTAPVNTDLIQWVLGWGTQAEVIKPKKLRNEMRMAGEYLVGTYQ